MNIFVAGPSEKLRDMRSIIAIVKSLGHECYDWTQDPGFQDKEKFDPLWSACRDLDAIDKCEGLIWVKYPKTKSEGAAGEALYAYALGKVVVPFWLDEPDENVIYASVFHSVNALDRALFTIAEETCPRRNPGKRGFSS